MERVTVTSSNIASIGYDETTSTLEIEFKNGSIYHYFDVPKNEYDGIVGAESCGKYLAGNIKGRYRYSRA